MLRNGPQPDQFNLHVHRPPLSVSGRLLRQAIALATPLSPVIPASFKLHPGRLAKLLRANDIRPTALVEMHYPFAWPLERALPDWLEHGL